MDAGSDIGEEWCCTQRRVLRKVIRGERKSSKENFYKKKLGIRRGAAFLHTGETPQPKVFASPLLMKVHRNTR